MKPTAATSAALTDHRVIQQYGGDVTQVNVLARPRKKVLAHYGAAVTAA